MPSDEMLENIERRVAIALGQDLFTRGAVGVPTPETICRQEVPALLAAVRRAHAALRAVEWVPIGDEMVCPSCFRSSKAGHDEHCRVGRELR